MATGVLMPKQGITVESCIITSWYKKKGDSVKAGEMLFGYETDKATFDCEAPEDGEILEIFFAEGDDVPVLTNVCVIGKAGEDISSFIPDGAQTESAPAASETVKEESAAAPAAAQEEIPVTPPTVSIDGELKISPRARNLAASKGVDSRMAAGTGPYGRVVEADIRSLMEKGVGSTLSAFDSVKSADAGSFAGSGIGGRVSVSDLSAPAAPAVSDMPVQTGSEYEDVKLSGIRKAISKSMLTSLSTIAQLTNNSSFDATEILGFRSKLKKNAESLGMPNITLNDIILYAVSRTLLSHKNLNAHMLEDNTLRTFNDVHLGIAVDTERGLMVPTIRYANRKSLLEISKEAKALAKAAQEGSINPDLLRGATFTISNLGSLGIETFTPVINPPQTGILGVNTLITRVREVGGELKAYQSMNLSLTYDHRVVDGAPAARFAKELATNLENFSLFLAKN